jgi:hypothetical protein
MLLPDSMRQVGTEKFEGEEGAEEEATDKVKAGSEKRGRRARAKTTKTRTAEKAEKKEPGMCTEPPKEAGGTCGDDKQVATTKRSRACRDLLLACAPPTASVR